jgi:hypothetical protein
VTLSHPASLAAVQTHPALVVTPTDPVVADDVPDLEDIDNV